MCICVCSGMSQVSVSVYMCVCVVVLGVCVFIYMESIIVHYIYLDICMEICYESLVHMVLEPEKFQNLLTNWNAHEAGEGPSLWRTGVRDMRSSLNPGAPLCTSQSVLKV